MPISNLVAAPTGPQKIKLTWTPLAGGTQSLWRGVAAGAEASLATLTATASSITDASCEDGKKYYYKIRSVVKGVVSWSNEVSATTPLTPPAGLDGYSNAGGIEAVLTWLDKSKNEGSFRIYMDGVLIHTTAANAITYTKVGLTPGKRYVFTVKAHSAAAGYSAASNALELTMADPPRKPTLLTAEATDTDKARLNWKDNSDNELDFHVERSATSALIGFAQIGTVGKNVRTYEDTVGLASGTQYWYRVRAHNGSGYSGYSNVATTVTFAAISAPTNLVVTQAKVGGVIGVECVFDDNSESEDGHSLERESFKVEKVTDGGLEAWTSPTNLTNWTEALAGTSTINKEAVDRHGGLYSARFDIDAANNTALISEALTLVAGGFYKLVIWYKTAAGKTCGWKLYNSGSNVWLKTDGTWAAVAQNNVLPAATAWTQYVLYFYAHAAYTAYVLVGGRVTGSNATSSSFYFDDISVKEFGYAEIVLLAQNQTYYHDTDVVAGENVSYRARAKQGGSYSGYSEVASITVLRLPSPPAPVTVPEYQDTWARLAWDPDYSAAIDGFAIEESDDGGLNYTEVLRIADEAVDEIKLGGLIPSTEYYWQIRSYNAQGYSPYSVPVSQTTRAAYLPSKFEKLMKRSRPRLMFLVEANPLVPLSGWTLIPGLDYTYTITPEDATLLLDALYENGVELRLEDGIGDVETFSGTWYQASAGSTIYVHTLEDEDPANSLITGSKWLYFSYGRTGDVVYNGHPYLPLVARGGIPDISQEIQPYYEGSYRVSSGTVSLINGKKNKEFFFDRLYARYYWLNRKVRILAGGESFAYADFKAINTGAVSSVAITDRRMSLDLRDLRDGMKANLPPYKYSLDEFPFMDPERVGAERPFGFGAVVAALPVCIDTVSRRFEFHKGRVKSVSVTQNGAPLVEDVDYFVDYQRGRITLEAGLAWVESDIILVSFTGCVNLSEETLATGAEIFKHICQEFLGLALDDLNLDWIYEAKLASPTALSLYLNKPAESDDVFRTIEQSIQAYTMQDGEGRVGIRAEQTAPDSGAPYVKDCQVLNFSAKQDQSRIYSSIEVFYAEDAEEKYELVTTTVDPVVWKQAVRKTLSIYTAVATAAGAADLGTAIASIMVRPYIEFTVPSVLYLKMPGDVIWFSRDRFPSLAGSAENIQVRLLGVTKQVSAGKTVLKGEVI